MLDELFRTLWSLYSSLRAPERLAYSHPFTIIFWSGRTMSCVVDRIPVSRTIDFWGCEAVSSTLDLPGLPKSSSGNVRPTCLAWFCWAPAENKYSSLLLAWPWASANLHCGLFTLDDKEYFLSLCNALHLLHCFRHRINGGRGYLLPHWS